MSKIYHPSFPIVVGLAGKAATGKTSAAETIVPKASFDVSRSGMVWEHLFFAMPLYELFSIRTKIEGIKSESRKLFSIHETLFDLYGGSALGNIPDYNDFVNLTNSIATKQIQFAGSKPRSFLQEVGDLCRAHDPDCFAKWGVRKAYTQYRDYIKGLSEEESEKPYCILISDVRFKNEADAILKLPNSMLILFDASEEVRRERIYNRDGVYMTNEQLSHKSEKEIESFYDLASVIIDSSTMSVEEQAAETIKTIKEGLGLNSYAQG